MNKKSSTILAKAVAAEINKNTDGIKINRSLTEKIADFLIGIHSPTIVATSVSFVTLPHNMDLLRKVGDVVVVGAGALVGSTGGNVLGFLIGAGVVFFGGGKTDKTSVFSKYGREITKAFAYTGLVLGVAGGYEIAQAIATRMMTPPHTQEQKSASRRPLGQTVVIPNPKKTL